MTINNDRDDEMLPMTSAQMEQCEAEEEAHDYTEEELEAMSAAATEQRRCSEDGPMCSTAEHTFRREACFGE